jgi:basic amino acid/polyamine antiporter, APA family
MSHEPRAPRDPVHEEEIRRVNAGLLPTLGLFTAVMLVVGGVIGSGIFRKPGVMAAQLGSPELLLGVWLLAGVITMMGALANAEVAGMIPETGGQFIYFERMYGRFFAFLYGWSIFAVIQTGSIAAVAYVFAEYSTTFLPLPEAGPALAGFSFHVPFIGDIAPFQELGVKLFAAATVVLLTAVNYAGVRFGGVVQNVFTIAKVAGMLLLVPAVLLLPETDGPANLTADSLVIRPQGIALLAAVAAALQGAFWAYDGWNKITFIAGEVKDPQRNVPRSLVGGMLLVTAVYLVMNAAYAWVLPVDEMAGSKLVAADAAERCFAGGGKWIALVVMLSTFGALNAIILASARVYFSMARRGVFPEAVGRAHPRFHTPGVSLVVQGVWSVALLFSGTFDTLTDTLIFVAWLFYGAGALGVIVLRRKEPETPRPYRVPLYPWLPAAFVAFPAVFLVLTVYNDITVYRTAKAAGGEALINSAFGTALVLAGTPVYLYYARRGTRGHGPMRKGGER